MVPFPEHKAVGTGTIVFVVLLSSILVIGILMILTEPQRIRNLQQMSTQYPTNQTVHIDTTLARSTDVVLTQTQLNGRTYIICTNAFDRTTPLLEVKDTVKPEKENK